MNNADIYEYKHVPNLEKDDDQISEWNMLGLLSTTK